ncbi:polyporus squamosus lectin [Sphaerosporella brunnea]|uniref:Polyporus squamosus lectin n=1 Tax=Sphaerosporella brunnea TaxID=1250544 RepID=A0A5J5EXK1_9PEZI|nr:polyporus squamosus lectin [Sphaerosporella brunnea]
MAEAIQNGAVYWITSKASPNLRLELSNGDPSNGTQAQGWQQMTDYAFYNQMWLVELVDGGYWTFRNLRSGTCLDLNGGNPGNGTKVQGWVAMDNNYNQHWAIIQLGGAYWKIKNRGTGTVIDLSGGGNSNGTKIQGWQDMANNPNQAWLFTRMTRTPTQIQALLAQNPRVAPVQFPSYADANYLNLPINLWNLIYAESMIAQNFHWRSEIFDCDDFAFTLKAAVAKHGNDWVRADGTAILCGFMFGRKPNGAHAYNWCLTDSLNQVTFIEPQNGTWSVDAFGYQAYFGVF